MYIAKKFFIPMWLGRYQSHLIYLYGGRRLKVNTYGLEKFFGHFPRAKYLTDFAVTDVTEYIEWRKSEGASEGTVKWELRSIRRFYSWLINHCNYPGPNPALAHSPLPGGHEKKCLRLEDLRRILAALDCPVTKAFVLSLVLGEPNLYGRTYTWFSYRLKDACQRCGIKWTNLSTFRTLIHEGLWSDIIHLNHKQLSDAFLTEAELNSDAFRNIKVSPRNVRPSVGDSDLDFFMIEGID